MSDMKDIIVSNITKYAKDYDKDIFVILYTHLLRNRIRIGDESFRIESEEEMSNILVKLRSMEKHINWLILIEKSSPLKTKKMSDWLFIENGDSIILSYYRVTHDNFITLVDMIRQYRIEKIFLKFDDEILMDIVRFISDVTKAHVYYQINNKFVHQNDFIIFED